jgi:hypothetical protein
LFNKSITGIPNFNPEVIKKEASNDADFNEVQEVDVGSI